MEPVPETERMEEFRSSPLPSLRLSSTSMLVKLDTDNAVRKPPTIRRSTDPSPISPSSPSWSPSALTAIPYRPRTTSPLSGGHSRSRSANNLAPPISRTQSMPGVSGSGHILYSPQLRPSSPSGSPSRARIPRKPLDEAFPSASPMRTSVLEPERRHLERSSSPGLGGSTTLPKFRRPASPLRSFGNSNGVLPPVMPSTPSSISSSPSYRPYESLGSTFGGSLSSVPSTPTSTRSRSPSISSLETIPDSPDAEEAALEADRIAQLKAAADAADGGDPSESRNRNSLDVPVRGRTLTYGSRDKRKRWSVCGAERRGDLDLETIWED
jgi:hypothetical protein